MIVIVLYSLIGWHLIDFINELVPSDVSLIDCLSNQGFYHEITLAVQ